MKQSASLKVITIIAMMFLYAMISFVTNLAAPVGKIWGESFTDPAQAERMGMLGNLFNFLAYLIMGIPAGNILSKYGYKKTALSAIVLGFAGIGFQWLSGYVDSFYVYLFGALLGGFCVCMLNTVTNPMLNLLGGGGNKGNQLNMIGRFLQVPKGRRQSQICRKRVPPVCGGRLGAWFHSREGRKCDREDTLRRQILLGVPSRSLRLLPPDERRRARDQDRG